MKKIMLCIALGLYLIGAYAQSDSSLIDTILVQSTVHSSSHISNIQVSENTINLVDGLQQNEAIYIKNYGGFNLSTLSIRGSSSSQTGIYWNNLSINNNMLGLLDLSLIPISFIEETAIVYGSESSNFGSGNIGGGLYLKNNPSKEKISLSTTISSFKNYSHSAKVNLGKKIKSTIKLNYQHFQNDYPYTISNGEERRLENGNGIQMHGMYNGNFKIGKNKLSFNYWGTYADRNIPYTSRQTSGDDSTIDFNNRFNLNLKRNINKSFIEWNSGYFINNNQFLQTQLINKNIIHSLENRLVYRKIKTNTSYTFGVDQSYHSAISQNYISNKTQSRIAVFSNFSWENKFLKIDLRARQEIINSKLTPFIPEIILSKNVFNNLRLSLKTNKVYRNPTLNDLYWNPGGNENLIPESGLAGEANINYIIKNSSITNSLNITAYNRIIQNWILWVPSENNFIFSPLNISEVWSRGLEFSNKLNMPLTRKTNLEYTFNYNLNRSSYQVPLNIPAVEKGDQLFYTPIHQMNNSFTLNFKNTSTTLSNKYFSSSIGINENVAAYNITNISISRKIEIKKNEYNISIIVNNLFNKSYEIIEFRPMPGRNFSLNLNYKLN
jgi:iron complex outermembrane receptor protein